MKLSRTAYIVDVQGIRITNLETNKLKTIQWDKIKSYSTRPYFTHSSEDGHLYVSTGKTVSQKGGKEIYSFTKLMLADSQRQKVKEILSSKLTEWKE